MPVNYKRVMLSPFSHRCQPADCFYIGPEVECARCGRIWKLTSRGYLMIPLVKRMPHEKERDARTAD